MDDAAMLPRYSDVRHQPESLAKCMMSSVLVRQCALEQVQCCLKLEEHKQWKGGREWAEARHHLILLLALGCGCFILNTGAR